MKSLFPSVGLGGAGFYELLVVKRPVSHLSSELSSPEGL